MNSYDDTQKEGLLLYYSIEIMPITLIVILNEVLTCTIACYGQVITLTIHMSFQFLKYKVHSVYPVN